MSDLLTSTDVVDKGFRKVMRGYDPQEVDDFLDEVAESIDIYEQQLKDLEGSTNQADEQLQEYKEIKDSLQNAMLVAQHTADEKIRLAQSQAEGILADARAKSATMLQDKERELAVISQELSRLKQVRDQMVQECGMVVAKFQTFLSSAQSELRTPLPEIQMPGSVVSTPISVAAPSSMNAEQERIAKALSSIGVDPKLVMDPKAQFPRTAGA